MTAMIGEYPTEEELRDRITQQLGWRNSSNETILIWHGYLAGLLEWSLIDVNVYDRLHVLLPRLGSYELFELFNGEPLSAEHKKEIDDYSQQQAKLENLA
jgi:hypothetical protein